MTHNINVIMAGMTVKSQRQTYLPNQNTYKKDLTKTTHGKSETQSVTSQEEGGGSPLREGLGVFHKLD